MRVHLDSHDPVGIRAPGRRRVGHTRSVIRFGAGVPWTAGIVHAPVRHADETAAVLLGLRSHNPAMPRRKGHVTAIGPEELQWAIASCAGLPGTVCSERTRIRCSSCPVGDERLAHKV